MDLKLDDLAEHFNFLDGLRLSGIVNMFGAASYLTEDMGVSKKDAKSVLLAWMQTFTEDKTPLERAQEFLTPNP